MKTGNNGSPSTASYDEALDALSSFITKRSRCDKTGDRFEFLFDYIKLLGLEEPISKLKVIHVAGTKGKGSTCTFTESVLRNCGFHTGLFTFPHLIDVRERFCLDCIDISKEKFLVYFWWCYNKLKENTNKDLPMPTLFCFLSLLALKIVSDEKVDVAILEVGLGGKFDATNVTCVNGCSNHRSKSTIVEKVFHCCFLESFKESLAVEDQNVSGNTLGEIAWEKAGIFKQGVPAFTVCQPDEAMNALQTKANKLNVHLQVVPPLDVNLLKGLKLGLEGEHQYINAGLAVALCSTWLQRTGNSDITNLENNSLPEQFLHGLTTTSFEGRAQIVVDRYTEIESPGGLVFFLDGAHSPESMEACAKWFSHAIKADEQREILNHQPGNHYRSSNGLEQEIPAEKVREDSMQILLFNCMSVRDPQLLLPRLIKTCADEGVHFKKALFTPNVSFHNKVGTHALTQANAQTDLSWQFKVQRMWENLMQTDKGLSTVGGDYKSPDGIHARKDRSEVGSRNCENSTVFSSLSSAITWLRTSVRQNRSVRLQVLVTGSLHLVGDVLRLVK